MLQIDDEDVVTDDVGQLIARAKDGDSDAFAILVETHYDLVYRTAYKWCGSRADAEDAAQDVCIKLGSAIRQFDGRSAFSSWLYRVTLNVVRDHQRARGRQSRQVRALTDVSTSESAPDQEEAATSRQLWDAVRRLPEQQRDAVLLIYAEGLSHAAASEIMGCKEATVSWHVHAARKTLRGLL